MICTNHTTKFQTALDNQIKTAKSLDICVGYCANKTIELYSQRLINIAKTGPVRLILGMYQGEGAFSAALYSNLIQLHKDLVNVATTNGIKGSGVYICKEREYSGKIYVIGQEHSELVWLGSNNFSEAGLASHLGACATIKDPKDVKEIKEYIDYLCSSEISVTIDKFRFTKAPEKIDLHRLPTTKTLPSSLVLDASLEIPLNVDEQERSALNLCFSSGRVDSKGIYTPRPWYEVEISSNQKVRSDSIYPQTNNVESTIKNLKKNHKCEFKALLFDGNKYYETKLSTYSDYNKAMGSNPRTVLGEFIKGKLQEAGVLKRGDLITSDTLAAYGKDFVTLTRYTDTSKPKATDLSDKVYILEF